MLKITADEINELVSDCKSSISMAWNDLETEIPGMTAIDRAIAKEAQRLFTEAAETIEKLKQ